MNIIGKTTVLSLALVATLLVVAVPGIDAEGATFQDIAAEDFLDLDEGGIITLDADYVLTTTPTITEDLIIDGQGHTIRGAINLDSQGTSEGAYTVVLKDLVMDGQGTTARAVTGQNQNEDVRPVNLTMEGVSISGYTSKGVYLTNIQSLNVTGCSFNDNATSEQTSYSGDYAFDINLCGIQNAVIVIEDTAFAGVSGGNSPIKITQRGGTDDTDDVSTDIHTSTAATIDSVTISGCTFDITAGTGGKNPMADVVIGSSPNSDGTARTYTQAYDLVVSTGSDDMTVAYRNGEIDDTENLLVFTLPVETENALVIDGTITEGAGACVAVANGATVEGTAGSMTIIGGYYVNDVSELLADGLACYDYSGIYFVTEAVESPALIIAGIPFASVEDALVLINIAGDFATADGDVLTLTANIPDTADVTLTIPEDSGLTIDLNGHDMAIGVVTVAGALNVTDSVGGGKLSASGINVTGGSIAGSGTIVAAEGTVNLVSIIGSGSASGVTLDISDVASNGGAINFETGLTGSASVYGVTILIDGTHAVADRGIYVNQMPETGSIVISDVTFDFNGNDACPLSADVDGNTDLEIDGFTFIDCSRTNKVLFNAMEDVTIGSKGGIDISDITDIVLWDAASADNVFTVAGDLVVNGRMAVTFNGTLLIPETETMTVNGSLEIYSDGSVEGRIYFGSNMVDSIVLTDVVPGDDALTFSLGSVVMSGSVVSGAMVIDGNGRTVGNLDLGGSELTVSESSTFTVGKDSEISGTAGMVVKGKVNVYGTVSAPIDNDGVVYTINNGAVTGEITGDEPQEKEDEPLSIDFVPDMTWTVGETYSIPLGIHPVDAVITGIHGAEDWLTFDGHILKGAPMETGTYEITLTIGLDSNTEPVTTDFTITVVEAQVDEPDDGWDIDWRYVLIAIVLIVMIVILVARFL